MNMSCLERDICYRLQENRPHQEQKRTKFDILDKIDKAKPVRSAALKERIKANYEKGRRRKCRQWKCQFVCEPWNENNQVWPILVKENDDTDSYDDNN
jgi:hypothetical protein